MINLLINGVRRFAISLFILAIIIITITSPVGRVRAVDYSANSVDTAYIKAEIDIHSVSKHNALWPINSAFGRGDTLNFYGFVDGYSKTNTTAKATFNVTITNPTNTVAFNQRFVADQIGGQDVVNFSYQIPMNASYGWYDVNFTVEKPGHKFISQNSPDPLIGYGPARFYVIWAQEKVIDVTSKYSLKILAPSTNETPKPFGPTFDIEAQLCPAPDLVSTYLYPEQAAAIVTATLHPIDEPQARHFLRNITYYITANQNPCAQPFTISNSGVMAASGRWLINVTAEWRDKYDPSQVYMAKSAQGVFTVSSPLYRTDNIIGLSSTSEKYRNSKLMDLRPDGKAVLLSYPTERLAMFRLDNSTGTMKVADGSQNDRTGNIIDFGNLTVAKDNQNPGVYRHIMEARFGAGSSNNSIYFVLDSGVYKYDFQNLQSNQSSDGSSLTLSSAHKLPFSAYYIDILSDGRIAYAASDTQLMISDPDGRNSVRAADKGPFAAGFDVSPDAKLVLYRKYTDVEYYQSTSILAYQDLQTGVEHIIPNIRTECGEPPRWAPNGFNIIYHNNGCWLDPGGSLNMTDINGSFSDPIIPMSEDNPSTFMFTHDGNSLLVGFGRCSSIPQTCAFMGENQSGFYVMTLARPVPEFGPSLAALSLASGGFLAIIALRIVSKRVF